jgi:tryptophan-rich sensory protein
MLSKSSYLLFIVLASLFINGLVWKLHLYKNVVQRDIGLLPAGYWIGIIWLVLLLCLGQARNIMIGHKQAHHVLYWLNIFLLWCFSYPLCMYLFGEYEFAPLICIFLSLFKVIYIYNLSKKISIKASYFILPTVIWLIYVFTVTVYQFFLCYGLL